MVDCLIVGAGHCGLLCASLLKDAGLSYLVLDEGERVGDVWRNRPYNMTLFTSRQFCSLGELKMPGDPKGFPLGREFADHVEQFSLVKALRVTLCSRVTRLYRDEAGFTAVLSGGETVRARTVINATGSNQEPIVPEFAHKLSASVIQCTARSFTSAGMFSPEIRVAVVGDGASGRQIARELSKSHRVTLARGCVRLLIPNRMLGQDIFWWLNKLGLLFAGTYSLVGRILRARNPIPAAADNNARLTKAGVRLCDEVVDAHGAELIFRDGSRQSFDAVVWSMGYRERLDWLELPLVCAEAPFVGSLGRTAESGFYVVGRKWLSCRASEIIMGALADATRVTGYVAAFCRQGNSMACNKEIVASV